MNSPSVQPIRFILGIVASPVSTYNRKIMKVLTGSFVVQLVKITIKIAIKIYSATDDSISPTLISYQILNSC